MKMKTLLLSLAAACAFACADEVLEAAFSFVGDGEAALYGFKRDGVGMLVEIR